MLGGYYVSFSFSIYMLSHRLDQVCYQHLVEDWIQKNNFWIPLYGLLFIMTGFSTQFYNFLIIRNIGFPFNSAILEEIRFDWVVQVLFQNIVSLVLASNYFQNYCYNVECSGSDF